MPRHGGMSRSIRAPARDHSAAHRNWPAAAEVGRRFTVVDPERLVRPAGRKLHGIRGYSLTGMVSWNSHSSLMVVRPLLLLDLVPDDASGHRRAWNAQQLACECLVEHFGAVDARQVRPLPHPCPSSRSPCLCAGMLQPRNAVMRLCGVVTLAARSRSLCAFAPENLVRAAVGPLHLARTQHGENGLRVKLHCRGLVVSVRGVAR